jgi:chromosome segregation ATPase
MLGASEAACAQEEKLKASLEEELRNCKGELNEAVTQLQHHDDERRQLQLNAEQYESKIGKLLLENSALKGELASALEKMESLQPDKLKAQLQKILGDMEVMQRKKVYEQDVEQARAERDEARHELDECKQQVQSLEQSLQNYKKAGHILAQDVVDFSAGLMQSVATPRHQPTSDGDC